MVTIEDKYRACMLAESVGVKVRTAIIEDDKVKLTIKPSTQLKALSALREELFRRKSKSVAVVMEFNHTTAIMTIPMMFLADSKITARVFRNKEIFAAIDILEDTAFIAFVGGQHYIANNWKFSNSTCEDIEDLIEESIVRKERETVDESKITDYD